MLFKHIQYSTYLWSFHLEGKLQFYQVKNALYKSMLVYLHYLVEDMLSISRISGSVISTLQKDNCTGSMSTGVSVSQKTCSQPLPILGMKCHGDT